MTHSELVRTLVKPANQIQGELDKDKVDLIHMSMGVATEAGELLDTIKKHTMYKQLLDVENVIEELGDIEFYLEGFRQNLGIDRQYVLDRNIKKLQIRYPTGGFTNLDAITRADKQ